MSEIEMKCIMLVRKIEKSLGKSLRTAENYAKELVKLPLADFEAVELGIKENPTLVDAEFITATTIISLAYQAS